MQEEYLSVQAPEAPTSVTARPLDAAAGVSFVAPPVNPAFPVTDYEVVAMP